MGGASCDTGVDLIWLNVINLLACWSDLKMTLSWTGRLIAHRPDDTIAPNKTLQRDKYQVLHTWSKNNTKHWGSCWLWRGLKAARTSSICNLLLHVSTSYFFLNLQHQHSKASTLRFPKEKNLGAIKEVSGQIKERCHTLGAIRWLLGFSLCMDLRTQT